jgi:hypothetical protein
VALPREAHQENNINSLSNGLGKSSTIALQYVLGALPKPFGPIRIEMTASIDTCSERVTGSRCSSLFTHLPFLTFVFPAGPANNFFARSSLDDKHDCKRHSATPISHEARDTAGTIDAPLLLAGGGVS